MAGKKLRQRDKEGVTVPLHVHKPVGPHIHPMTSAVRLATSYTAYVDIHARKRRHHLHLVVKNLGTLEMPGK